MMMVMVESAACTVCTHGKTKTTDDRRELGAWGFWVFDLCTPPFFAFCFFFFARALLGKLVNFR
jgi:hypothetical protein